MREILDEYVPYEKAISHWGKEKQIEKTIEELDELKEEIKLYLSGNQNDKELISEMADVMNMIVQLTLILGCGNRILDEMDRKMARTMDRIDAESGGD